jgi:ParB family chromosome partitioning protein
MNPVFIAKADTPETQRELLKAFETKQLNRVSIRVVKRLLDQRRFLGKEHNPEERGPERCHPTTEKLVNAFKRESQRQKELVRKARNCEAKLVFIVTAFGKLLADEGFLTLLRAEALDSIPQYLWSKLNHKPKEVV